MQRLVDHQTQLVCAPLGGPASFPDHQIRNAHRTFGITEAAFDEAVELFEEALQEAELEAADIAEVVKLFEAKAPPRRVPLIDRHAGYPTTFQCFNVLTLGIFVCDSDGLTIRFANERAEQWFGAGLQGRPLASVVPSLKEAAVAERMAKGREFTLTGEIAPPSGRRVAFRLSIALKRLAPDQLLVAAVEDISRLKEQEHLLESRMVERKTREIEKEKERAEKLLMNVFLLGTPGIQGVRDTTPSFYDEVSVMFLDFVDFTRIPVSKQPKQLISELNEIFSTFDQITEHHSCERIKTFGDAYLAVANMPSPNPDQALDITKAAIKILRYLGRRNLTRPITWTCRIGIHTGSVVGSVVGIRKYIYDVFGDG